MTTFHYLPPKVPLQILHECADFLALDKPPGLLSVPGRLIEHKDCLLTRAEAEFGQLFVVHRLDMDTSGIILFARSKAAQSAAARAFQQREVIKRYLSIVDGTPSAEKGRIDLPLRCDWPNRPKQMVDLEQGRASQTEWLCISRNETCSKLALMPVTGRSHQLRVHLAAIGHPIRGDRFYGGSRHSRLMLHAEHLAVLDLDLHCPVLW